MHLLLLRHLWSCIRFNTQSTVLFFLKCMLLGHFYHNIPPTEEEEHQSRYQECQSKIVPRMQKQNIRFDSWSEQECYVFTGFGKHQPYTILSKFWIRARSCNWWIHWSVEQKRPVPPLPSGGDIPVHDGQIGWDSKRSTGVISSSVAGHGGFNDAPSTPISSTM